MQMAAQKTKKAAEVQAEFPKPARKFKGPDEFMLYVERTLRAHRVSKGGAKRIRRFFESYLHCRYEEKAITERTYELLSNLLDRALATKQHRSPDKIIADISKSAKGE